MTEWRPLGSGSALAPGGVQLARKVAERRVKRVLTQGLGYGKGEPRAATLDTHLPGALAELIVADSVGAPWPQDEDDFGKAGDVCGLEVRGTFHHNAHLIFYRGDPPNRLYVLVCIDESSWRYRIAGWITGYEGQGLAGEPPVPLRPHSPYQVWLNARHLHPWGGLIQRGLAGRNR